MIYPFGEILELPFAFAIKLESGELIATLRKDVSYKDYMEWANRKLIYTKDGQ